MQEQTKYQQLQPEDRMTIANRVMPGHWEGDFIKGAGNKFSVGVLVERTSRLVLLAKNTNGLLRQYLPKGTDLSAFSQDELDAIADGLNTRPRATHGFHTSLAVFARMLALIHLQSPSTH